MDAYLSPTNRLREVIRTNIIERHGEANVDVAFRDSIIRGPESLDQIAKVELNVSFEELLASGVCTWETLNDIIERHDAVWFNEDCCVTFTYDNAVFSTGWVDRPALDTQCNLEVNSQRGRGVDLSLRGRSWDQIAPCLEFMMTVLEQYTGTTPISSVTIAGADNDLFEGLRPVWPLSLDALRRFITLQSFGVKFSCFTFYDAQGRVLAEDIDEDLELSLSQCIFADGGTALIEALRGNRGPTKLSFLGHDFDAESFEGSSNFMDAISGHTSLRSLSWCYWDIPDTLMLPLCVALRDNQGLIELGFGIKEESDDEMSEENWGRLMNAVAYHPTLKTLYVRDIFCQLDWETEDVGDSHKQTRSEALLEMIKKNSVLNTIDVDPQYFDQTIWQQVQQYLEVNKHRSRVHELKTEADAHLRPRFLRGAMYNVRDKQPALMYMLAKENVDLVMEYLALQKKDRRYPVRKRKRLTHIMYS